MDLDSFDRLLRLLLWETSSVCENMEIMRVKGVVYTSQGVLQGIQAVGQIYDIFELDQVLNDIRGVSDSTLLIVGHHLDEAAIIRHFQWT